MYIEADDKTKEEVKEVNLEPIFRKTKDGTPVKLLYEIPAYPVEHGYVKVLVYPNDTSKQFEYSIRADALVPPYTPSKGASLKVGDKIFVMPKVLTAEEKAAQEAIEAASTDPAVIRARAERMEHARKHRQPNPEFNGIPDTIVCTNCGESKKVVKANVLKYAKADNISIEDYVKNFQCPTCNPRKKGRQTSGKYALLPKSLVCHFEGCNKVLVQHPSMTEKQAQAAGVGFNEFCEKWMCKEHRPKKAHYFSKEARENRGEKVNIPVKGTNEPKMGTGRRGRQASEKWAGMASELKCNHEGCTKIQKQHPSLTMAAAKRHGKTFEEFLNTWKCKEHRKEQKSSSTV